MSERFTFRILGQLLSPDIEPPDPVFRPPKPWKPGRPENFANDIKEGNNILDRLKNIVYQEAKKEAALPSNPISPPSAEGLLSTLKDVATGGELPALAFAKMILGDLFDVAASNMAGPVAKVRRRAYGLFIAGFVQVVAEQDVNPPTDPFDKKYFDLGERSARTLSEIQRYQVQLALLHYFSQNPPSTWGFPRPLGWTSPDDYGRNWSPERLGTAFYNQLYHARYSID